jgi:hypothetical protein
MKGLTMTSLTPDEKSQLEALIAKPTTAADKSVFKNVWYQAKLGQLQNPDGAWDDPTRFFDVGTLTIEDNSIKYTVLAKPDLVIKNIKNISFHKKQIIKVDYVAGIASQTAYFGIQRSFIVALIDGAKPVARLMDALQTLPLDASGPQLPKDEALEAAIADVCRYAVKLKKDAGSGTQMQKRLVELGLTAEAADSLIHDGLEQVGQASRAGVKNLFFGALWFVGGLIVTVVTFNTASGGGTYFVAYGAILAGSFQSLFGIIQFLQAPRGETQVTQIKERVMPTIRVEDIGRWKTAAANIRNTKLTQ